MTNFSPNAVQRIRASVKYTEGQRSNLRGPHSTPIRRARPENFWAYLSEDLSDATSGPTGWSFVEQIPDGTGGFTGFVGQRHGTGTAFAYGGKPKVGDYVWMTPGAMIDDADGNQVPSYLFVVPWSPANSALITDITISNSWTVPDNVFHVRIISIAAGGRGADGQNSQSLYHDGTVVVNSIGMNGMCGPGGETVIAEVDVTPGDILNASIGNPDGASGSSTLVSLPTGRGGWYAFSALGWNGSFVNNEKATDLYGDGWQAMRFAGTPGSIYNPTYQNYARGMPAVPIVVDPSNPKEYYGMGGIGGVGGSGGNAGTAGSDGMQGVVAIFW